MQTSELANDLAMAFDPVVLAEAAGYIPDKWQRDFLRSTVRRVLLNCCRQSGKSTTTATLALHTALYDPASLTLLLSPGERQSKELLRKVLDQYHALGQSVPADAENKLTLELSNGSRIVALPGNETTIRGYSGARLLVVDEASRVPDTMMAAIRPMLAVSGGRLVGLSTPWGKRGWWYDAWTGKQPWQRVKITALQCPRISAEFLQEERETLGDLFYRSEYNCEFVETADSVFSDEDIQAMLDPTVKPLFALPQEAAWMTASLSM
jgi:hypothetical protein